MKVIFLAYREWAHKVFPTINNHPNVNEVAYCTNQDQLDILNINEFDLLKYVMGGRNSYTSLT